jgi:beta-lactam-binding protein with PASTA domain
MEGKTYTDVVKILEKLDVTIKKDTTASTKYNAGIVVDVDKAGQSVEEGSTVIIYVSDGPGPGTTEPTPPSNGQ